MAAACLPSWYPYFSDWYFANINTEKQWLLWSCVSVETIEPAEVWTPPYSHLHCPTQIYRVGQIKILCATKSQGSLENAHFSFSVYSARRHAVQGILMHSLHCRGCCRVLKASSLGFFNHSLLNTDCVLYPCLPVTFWIPSIVLSCFFWVTSLLESWCHSRKSFRGISF